ncbi:uncharacterized protein LOC129741763 [Uranotaenia lowii]|uniref:uncharacterized protein LOC129741763 n=1 Tax=Uranotaenia lowii TaxID=190385 RepID=UPI00247B2D05|nr:uncharacterized protein LOC129741763 [Uranotaenia lowii]
MKSFVCVVLCLVVAASASTQMQAAVNDLAAAGQTLRNTVLAANVQNPAIKSVLAQISADADAFIAIAQRDTAKPCPLDAMMQNDLLASFGSLTSMLGELNSGVQNAGNIPVVKDALTRFIMNGNPVLNNIQNVLASIPDGSAAEAVDAIRKVQSDLASLQVAAQL